MPSGLVGVTVFSTISSTALSSSFYCDDGIFVKYFSLIDLGDVSWSGVPINGGLHRKTLSSLNPTRRK